MKNCKRLSHLFIALAVLLSDVMCASVAYSYCNLQLCPECSAPAWVAFWWVIPYGTGIAICAALARIFHKKHQKTA